MHAEHVHREPMVLGEDTSVGIAIVSIATVSIADGARRIHLPRGEGHASRGPELGWRNVVEGGHSTREVHARGGHSTRNGARGMRCPRVQGLRGRCARRGSERCGGLQAVGSTHGVKRGGDRDVAQLGERGQLGHSVVGALADVEDGFLGDAQQVRHVVERLAVHRLW